MGLTEFLYSLPLAIPGFCEALVFTTVYGELPTDEARLTYLINTLHKESFCGGDIDPYCGEEYLDRLWNAIKYSANRIDAIYGW